MMFYLFLYLLMGFSFEGCATPPSIEATEKDPETQTHYLTLQREPSGQLLAPTIILSQESDLTSPLSPWRLVGSGNELIRQNAFVIYPPQ